MADISNEIDPYTQKLDGSARHPSIIQVLKHFRYAHLPLRLQRISKPCCDMAMVMADNLPESSDLTHGLRNLLLAKDDFVRAAV